MVLSVSLLLASVLVFSGQQQIRKHPGLWYGVTAGISAAVILAVWSGLIAGLQGPALTLAQIFTQGGLAGALFLYIMFASAVPARAPLKKQIMPIRGTLSIMASILTLGHNIAYGKTYFVLLFTQALYMKWNILLAALCSLCMILIMLPLFITSFPKIRRRMKASSWKRLQRLAYLFYGLLYTHLMLLYLPSALGGKLSAAINVILYSILYLSYASMRISRVLEKKDARYGITAVRIFFGLLFIGLLGLVSTASADPAQNNSQSQETTETAAISTPETAAGQTTMEPVSIEQESGSGIRYEDGTYTGAGIGYNGRLTVSVTIEEGKISDAHLKGSIDDEPYLTDAVEGVFPAILDAGTTEVDVVSGATTTSHALIEAVEEALSKAQPE
ncbi:MAG: FMN-binding protein [Parasporobacterium sp.]|nr:FMN-binding protein [Parasporobacterium sp.]